MRPRIENSVGDEAMEDYGFLKFTDEKHKGSFLNSLATMRKHRLFCDVVINVDNADIHAHKNVLACVSPHLMELFSAEQENQFKHSDGIPSYRLNGGITKQALQILVEYAYTAQLEVPDPLVQDVYVAAWQLRIENIVNECAKHLVKELCVDTCIEIRSLPGINRNKVFVQAVDAFISREFVAVSETTGFCKLPCATVDVLYHTKQEMAVVTHDSLCRLVFDWAKRLLSDETITMNNLLERGHLLYLALDNSLQDCCELPAGQGSDSELVQDYKRLALKNLNNKGRRKGLAKPDRPRVLIYSRDIGNGADKISMEPDWNLLGSAKVAGQSFVCLVTLNGVLTRISIQMRLNFPVPSASPVHSPESVSTTMDPTIKSTGQTDFYCEVATMSGPKCGLGVSEWEGKLLVCGGYDRTECLKSVESYCPKLNKWTVLPNMLYARGRFQIAVLNGNVYAIGGSNGTTELDTVECLPPNSPKWEKRCRLPLARSNACVCVYDDRIYCIGGWNGQSGIKQCDVYCDKVNKWTSIPPLKIGRTQSGSAVYNHQIWVAGGSDSWNCLSSVETYNVFANEWNSAPPLLTARRGCGMAVFNGKIYVVGGSDGTHSLNSTEIYDEDGKVWVLGPSMITPRANVSVVVVQGKLYAIGGFSGKTFLNTMEYLDPNTNEWTTFVHQLQTDTGSTDLTDLTEPIDSTDPTYSLCDSVSDYEDNGQLNGDNHQLNGHNNGLATYTNGLHSSTVKSVNNGTS